jgi:hypothetical protein
MKVLVVAHIGTVVTLQAVKDDGGQDGESAQSAESGSDTDFA